MPNLNPHEEIQFPNATSSFEPNPSPALLHPPRGKRKRKIMEREAWSEKEESEGQCDRFILFFLAVCDRFVQPGCTRSHLLSTLLKTVPLVFFFLIKVDYWNTLHRPGKPKPHQFLAWQFKLVLCHWSTQAIISSHIDIELIVLSPYN